jgi:hypothetical protein
MGFNLDIKTTRKLYFALEKEWIDDKSLWRDFINKKDIGIRYTNLEHKIVDEKKWALAKIKYGF